MQWEQMCIEAAHPLCVERALSEEMLSALEASVNASAELEYVRAAAKALIEVPKRLEQLRGQPM